MIFLLQSDHIACPGHRPHKVVSEKAARQSRRQTPAIDQGPADHWSRQIAGIYVTLRLRGLVVSLSATSIATGYRLRSFGVLQGVGYRLDLALSITLEFCARATPSERGETGSPVLPSGWANNGSNQAITCRPPCFRSRRNKKVPSLSARFFTSFLPHFATARTKYLDHCRSVQAGINGMGRAPSRLRRHTHHSIDHGRSSIQHRHSDTHLIPSLWLLQQVLPSLRDLRLHHDVLV